jgi:hypothetical protein
MYTLTSGIGCVGSSIERSWSTRIRIDRNRAARLRRLVLPRRLPIDGSRGPAWAGRPAILQTPPLHSRGSHKALGGTNGVAAPAQGERQGILREGCGGVGCPCLAVRRMTIGEALRTARRCAT